MIILIKSRSLQIKLTNQHDTLNCSSILKNQRISMTFDLINTIWLYAGTNIKLRLVI